MRGHSVYINTHFYTKTSSGFGLTLTLTKRRRLRKEAGGRRKEGGARYTQEEIRQVREGEGEREGRPKHKEDKTTHKTNPADI